MTKITQWVRHSSVLLGVVASIAVIATFSYATLSPRVTHAAAGTGGDLHGYAWSSTIGWVSMNCAEGSATGSTVCATSNYKVTLDPATQLFSGYAWSANVGWVSFNPSDVSFCGSQSALSAGRMIGWARVLSGAYPNGADGCISFGSASTSTYGVNVDSVAGTFSGYAWGSITLGWLDFSRLRFRCFVFLSIQGDAKSSQEERELVHGMGEGGLNIWFRPLWTTKKCRAPYFSGFLKDRSIIAGKSMLSACFCNSSSAKTARTLG